MAHKLFILLGKIYWIYRLLIDYFSEYFFSFLYHGKHQPLPPITDPLLLESATKLAHKIRHGQVRSEDVIKAYIKRIHDVNMILNAMVDERFADAILDAQKADALVASGQYTVEELATQFPFLGIPFTTKDCFNVKGLRQTSGLVSKKYNIADHTASAIQQMMAAGAILLGVCNTSELISWAESHNHVYGRTNNAYDTTRSPGGSSGGDGVLVSACGSLVAVGTDIGGSIRIPSLCNGIFGHKTSRACVPMDGMVPPNDGDVPLYNTIGPMCRYAEDVIPMFKILFKSTEVADKLQLDQPVDLGKLKIFYMDDFGGNQFPSPPHPEIKSAMQRAMMHMERNYGIKCVRINIPEFDYATQMYGVKIKAAAGNVTYSSLLANGKGEVNGVVELIKALFFCSDFTMASILLACFEKIMNDDQDYVADITAKYNSLQTQLSNMLGENGVLFFPTQPNAANYHNQPLVHILDLVYTGIFNVLSFPSTHCPMGLNSKGLPIGFQVVSNFYHDRNSLAVARELEKAFGGWVPPSPIKL